MTVTPKRQSPHKTILSLFGVLLLLLAGASCLFRRWTGRQPPAEASPIAKKILPVKTYRIRPQKLEGVLLRNGTIRPHRETNLQFGVAGRLVKFDVEKGQFVRKDALLAQLDPSEAKSFLDGVELDFRRASLKYYKDRSIDKLEFDRAKLRYQQAKLEYEKTSLRAPHSGFLVEKSALPGEHVESGTVVGKLVDKSRVFVELSLTEQDIAYLQEGQGVGVTVDALPDFRAEGKVRSITPYLEGNARSFTVKVTLPENPGEALTPGMYARCQIHRYIKDAALTVPTEAVVDTLGKQARVFVVDAQNRAFLRTVPVLFSSDKEMEIGEVSEGDMVILAPSLLISDGAKVEVSGVFDPAASQSVPPTKEADHP
ncbi:MAG TPA: efflux RND transporter periplasmic adaptor subunit [Elusimicrobiota bacterium]|nr:efflux RND transporter periplasmic adaptor subunit [Elusimicrobiota bacterium]